jgi:ABC-type uncharacterized transport system fused permease/ATPase subunit
VTRPPDSELAAALRAVRLDAVIAEYGGLDSKTEWSTMLSLGEQQRLAFARLLLARPSLALLDESTRFAALASRLDIQPGVLRGCDAYRLVCNGVACTWDGIRW